MKLSVGTLLPLLTAVILCISCTVEQDPIATAIGKELLKDVPEGGKFRMDRMEKIDSSTFRTEFGRRTELFETKANADFKLYNDYFERGLRQNVARKLADIDRDRMIVDSLKVMLERMGDDADKVAFYDICFSAEASVGGASQILTDCYASVTPDGEVLCITRDRKDLHKTTGKVIPGYLELIKEDDSLEY